MKNALIIYHSKTGTTQNFGNEIKSYCLRKGIKTKVISIKDFKNKDLNEIDYLFLGTWTKGLIFFAQHPDKNWKLFAKSLQIPEKCKVILFTTYKVSTGSIFTKMKKHLSSYLQNIILEIKSRNGILFNDMEDLINNSISISNSAIK